MNIWAKLLYPSYSWHHNHSLPRSRTQALPQLLYQQVEDFWWASLSQSCRNSCKKLHRLKVDGASSVARDMLSCPSFWLSVLLFWLKEFQWVRKATLELSSLKRKLTVLIVKHRLTDETVPAGEAGSLCHCQDQVSNSISQNSGLLLPHRTYWRERSTVTENRSFMWFWVWLTLKIQGLCLANWRVLYRFFVVNMVAQERTQE